MVNLIQPDVLWLFSLLVKSPRFIVLLVFVAGTWVHRSFYSPVANWCIDTGVGQTEEAVKVVIREVTNFLHRLINGVSYYVCAFFGATYGRGDEAWADVDTAAWAGRESTFNALIARVSGMPPGVC